MATTYSDLEKKNVCVGVYVYGERERGRIVINIMITFLESE